MMSLRTKYLVILSLFFSLLVWFGLFLVGRFWAKGQPLTFNDCLRNLSGKVILGLPEQCLLRKKLGPARQTTIKFIEGVSEAKINNFFFETGERELVVKSQNLTRVEIWGKQGNKEALWGQAVLSSEEKGGQRWLFKLPEEPILVTELFSRGFNSEDKAVTEFSFPLSGAASLFQLFWAGPTRQVFGVKPEESFKLFPGQVGILENSDLAVSFEKLNQDSRCPIGVYCVTAGQVSLKFKIYFADQLPLSVNLVLDPQRPELATFEDMNYSVELISVLPSPIKNEKIPASNYQAVLKIHQLVQ